MGCKRRELESYLREFLATSTFKDYGPNGLQITGKDQIDKVGFAVSATRESVEKAEADGLDALIVHHGLFWVFHGARPLTGPFYQRVAPLLKNDINLFGYHLPLDAHPEVGNACALANLLGLTNRLPYGDYKSSPMGLWGHFPIPLTSLQLQENLKKILHHEVILSTPNTQQKIKSLAIITGGANSAWTSCLELGIDAYLTGEISEHDWHEAKEAGLHFFAGGHHATEQFGIQLLQKHLEEKFNFETVFYPSLNPA